MAWTQEQKDAVVEAYTAEDPTAETTEEIMQMISDDTQDDEEPRTLNAIRRVLTNADVYVKKEAAAKEVVAKKVRVTPKARALANFGAICGLNSVTFALDEDDTKKMTAKVLEAVIDLVGQVGEELPEEEDA